MGGMPDNHRRTGHEYELDRVRNDDVGGLAEPIRDSDIAARSYIEHEGPKIIPSATEQTLVHDHIRHSIFVSNLMRRGQGAVAPDGVPFIHFVAPGRDDVRRKMDVARSRAGTFKPIVGPILVRRGVASAPGADDA